VNGIISNHGLAYNYYCLGLEGNDNVSFFVGKNKTKSPFGAVVFISNDHGVFNVHLEHISETIQKLVFTISKNDNSPINSAKINIGQNSPELQFNFTGEVFRNGRDIDLIEFYRKDSIWKMRVVVENLQENLKKFLKEITDKKTSLTQQKQSTPVPVQPVSTPLVPPRRPTPPPVSRDNYIENLRGLNKVLTHCLGDDFKRINTIARQYCIRHLCWTLWFWFPFGAFFGWLHLALKTYRFEFVRNTILYGIACIIPYCLSLNSLNLGLIIIVPWVLGLVHCYGTFKTTFLQTIDSCGRKGFTEVRKDKEERYDLNTITYEVFFNTSVPNDWALPILADRCKKGFYYNMEHFYTRLNLRPEFRKEFEKIFYVEAVTDEQAKKSKQQRKRIFIFATILFSSLILTLCGGIYGLLQHSPELKQYVYTTLNWDYYKNAQGIGSGVNKSEALHNAKVNALANGLGEELFHKEVGTIGSVTISNDSGDKTTMSQDEKENYTKQVQGRVSDVEIISESQSPDGLYNITIKAKVLMNANREKK
jgi:hypothetical protein